MRGTKMNDKLKVLIVDDNEDFCENVKDVMELKGYEVETAYDGFEALDIVRKNGIDLVVMDIKMPAMNGVETFKKMKELIPGTPVIMVTAFAVEELIRESLNEGAFGCIRKPLDFDKLFEMIDSALPDGSMILIIDDDENLCENMRIILIGKGYRVNIAKDSDMAIQKTKENDFDIMLLDMKLPPLNGLETYLAIKELRPNIVTIVITGYMQDMYSLVEDTLKKGAYICLEKPIKMDELISIIGRIEEKKKGS